MNLFYNQHIKETDDQILFDKEESRHITKVLRKKIGDQVYSTNGNGAMFTSEILSITPKQSIAKIVHVERMPKPKYHIHMAVAPTKNNDRFEWFLEKATEIGITSITPIICDHSERKIIKPERYEKIIQSAVKQSLKSYMPSLLPIRSFKECVETFKDSELVKLIAHCEDRPKKHLYQTIEAKQDVLVFIGPEGDFSPKEIDFAIENGWTEVSLGTSRLRTETAAIAACHAISLKNQV